MIAGLITVALFVLAIALLAEPRGRHHVHARLLARPFERRRLTVAELEARLDAEARRPRLHFSRAMFNVDPVAEVKAGVR